MDTKKPPTMFDKDLASYCGANVIEYLKLVPVEVIVPAKHSTKPESKQKPRSKSAAKGTATTAAEPQKKKARVKRVFQVYVKGQWEAQEILLITANKREPRGWASLDRAEEHFRKNYHFAGPIIVMIGT